MKALLLAFVLLFSLDDKPKLATIPVPEIDQLQWSNLRLQASNLRLQADALDAKANEKLVEIKKLAGPDADAYDFQFGQDGKMQLVRRPDKKEIK